MPGVPVPLLRWRQVQQSQMDTTQVGKHWCRWSMIVFPSLSLWAADKHEHIYPPYVHPFVITTTYFPLTKRRFTTLSTPNIQLAMVVDPFAVLFDICHLIHIFILLILISSIRGFPWKRFSPSRPAGSSTRHAQNVDWPIWSSTSMLPLLSGLIEIYLQS